MQSLTDESQIAEWRQYMQDYSSRKRPQAVGNSEVLLSDPRSLMFILIKKKRQKNMRLIQYWLSTETRERYRRLI